LGNELAQTFLNKIKTGGSISKTKKWQVVEMLAQPKGPRLLKERWCIYKT